MALVWPRPQDFCCSFAAKKKPNAQPVRWQQSGTNRATIQRIRGEARRILRRLQEALGDFEKSASGGDEFAMVRRSTVLRELNQLEEAKT